MTPVEQVHVVVQAALECAVASVDSDLVRDHTCGCRKYRRMPLYSLCGYHQGMNDAAWQLDPDETH